MRIQKVLLVIILNILCFQCLLPAVNAQGDISVKIRITEEDSLQVTPAMVCIINAEDGFVRVPPEGQIPKTSSDLNLFFKGIEYSGDRNWTGPVRKTTDKGIHGFYSFAYKGLSALPYWSEPAMYQVSGDFTIKLQKGKWRISIEHGNEYIPVQEEFVLTGKETEVSKSFIMKRWIDLPQKGWYSGDIHVHHPTTKPGFKDFLFEYAKAEDVHLLNILEMGDHHQTDFKQEGFGENFRSVKGEFSLVSGQEDPRSIYGHIIGLNIKQLARDTLRYNYYDVIFKMLHEQDGALAGFAHFAWNGNGVPMGVPLYINTGEVDFVELLQNSQINIPDYHDLLNLGLRITAAAGSDVPWGATIGEVRTFVYTGKEFSASAWFRGMTSGHTFVSNGPALFLEIDDSLPGSELFKSADSKAGLMLKAVSNPGIGNISRVAIYNNDGLLVETANPGKLDSVEIKMTLTLTKSQWIAAVVSCDNGAVAHTTPVYIIVDGHPTWDAGTAREIVYKKLGAIKMMEDMEAASLYADKGMLDRLKAARIFYNKLLFEIDNDH